jgi:uncharacterized protein involved in outer membrane biogenesis
MGYMIRRVLLGVFSLIILLVGGALIVPSFIDWSSYRQPAIDAAESATGYKVTIDGPISLSLIPSPTLSVKQITVRLPEQGSDDYVAKLDRLYVSIALLPLLSGKVDVTDVQLAKPDIRVTLGADGQPTAMTPKIKVMTGGEQTPTIAPASSSGMNINLQQIAIRDGHVVVNDTRSKQIYDVQAIRADIGMDSLQGPFDVDASMIYRDVALNVAANVGKLTDAGDIPVTVKFGAPDQQTTIGFAGSLANHAGWEAQGQLDVKGRNWIDAVTKLSGQAVPAPNQPLSLTGLLTANAQSVTLDNLDFDYGDLALKGSIKTRLAATEKEKPFVQVRLSSEQALNAQKLMASFGGAAPAAASTTSVAPKQTTVSATSIKLPIDLDAEIKAPAVQLAAEPFKDVVLKLDAKNDEVRGRFVAGSIPGKGNIDVTVYPGAAGIVMLDTKLNVKDATQLVTSGLGMPIPVGVPLGKFHDVALTADISYTPNNIDARSGTIIWSGGNLSFTGSGYRQQKNGRALAVVTLGGDKLDLDDLLGVKPTPAKTTAAPAAPLRETISATTKSIKLPMDIDFALSFAKLITGGQTIGDLNAVGKLAGDSLTLSTLDIGNVQGVSLRAHGTVDDIAALKGINMNLTARAKDADATLKTFGIVPPVAGRDVGPAGIDVAYQGSVDQGSVDADVAIWGITVGAAGPVRDPFGVPQVDNLKLSVSALKSGDLIKIVQPGFKMIAPLEGAAKLTSDMMIKGKTYTLKNISGNVGTMVMKGDLTADLSTAKPALSGGLELGDVPLDALMGVSRSAPTTATKQASGSASTPRWSTEAIDTAWMRMMDLDFAVTAKSLTYNLWQLSKPSLAFSLKGGKLGVRDMNAGLFGGTLQASGDMAAAAAGQPITMNWSGKMNSVNARSLTNALVGSAMNRMDGNVGMQFDIASTGVSPSALVQGLKGTAASQGSNIMINGIDVTNLVSWLTTDLKPSTTIDGLTGSFFGGSTAFATHVGAYTISNGTVTLDKFLFDGDKASLSTAGSVSLPAWSMETKSTLLVKNNPDVPELSFTLRGPLDNPARNMGQDILKGYLNRKLEKQAGKLLQGKLGKKLDNLGLGGLLGGNDAPAAPVVEPAQAVEPVAPATTEPVPEAAPVAPQKVKPEDVLIDVLKGLGR